MHLRQWTAAVLLGMIIFLAGCGADRVGTMEQAQERQYDVTCIAVLPAVPMIDPQVEIPKDKEKRLTTGAETLNSLLRQELGSQPNIRFVDQEQLAGVQLDGGEDTLELDRLIGRDLNCSAVLESYLWRYAERVGGKYTVEEPASVAFDLRLVDIESGRVIWTARFNETQQSVLENLFELGKARTRGFTWITAEELMREGLREKIRDSRYLHPLPAEEKSRKSLPPV